MTARRRFLDACEKGHTWEKRFASWGAFLDFVQTVPTREEPFDQWVGPWNPRTMEDVQHDARYGSARLVADLQVDKAMMLYREAGARIARAEYSYEVTGEVLDVGAYLAGEPECWLNEYEEMARGQVRRHFRVLFNTGITEEFTERDYKERGSVLFTALALMERAGFALTLDVGSHCWMPMTDSHGGSGFVTIISTFKEPDQPIDLARLAFVLTDVCMHRRLMFRARGLCENRALAVHRSVGGSLEFTDEIKAQYDFVTPPLHPNVVKQLSQEGGRETWVLEFLKQHGVELT